MPAPRPEGAGSRLKDHHFVIGNAAKAAPKL